MYGPYVGLNVDKDVGIKATKGRIPLFRKVGVITEMVPMRVAAPEIIVRIDNRHVTKPTKHCFQLGSMLLLPRPIEDEGLEFQRVLRYRLRAFGGMSIDLLVSIGLIKISLATMVTDAGGVSYRCVSQRFMGRASMFLRPSYGWPFAPLGTCEVIRLRRNSRIRFPTAFA